MRDPKVLSVYLHSQETQDPLKNIFAKTKRELPGVF